MYEIYNFLSGISSCSPICDISDIRCIVNENMQRIAFFCLCFTATRKVTIASKIRDREVNLRINLHISYIDQLMVPAILNYLIGAKNVDRMKLNLRCVFNPCHPWIHPWPRTVVSQILIGLSQRGAPADAAPRQNAIAR